MSVTSALYTGVSGLINNGNAINVIGNNISNVNTVGFKDGRTTFADLLSNTIGNGSQIGTGSQLQAVQNIFTQGTPTATGNVTDMMVQGDSFFAVQSPTLPATSQSTALLTRNGAFTVNSNLQLVDASGNQVLDTSGKPIIFVNSGASPTTDFGKITNISTTGVITYLATDGVTQNYYNVSAGTKGANQDDTVNASVSTAAAAAQTAANAMNAAAADGVTYAAALVQSTAHATDTGLAAATATALATLNSANAAAKTAADAALAAANTASNAAIAAAAANVADLGLANTVTTMATSVASATTADGLATAAAADTTGATQLAVSTVGVPNAGDQAVIDANAAATDAAAAAAAAGSTAGRAVTAANAATVQRIALVHVTDPTALTKMGGSLYQSNPDCGVSTAAFSLAANSANGTSESILSNNLEASNVDMSTEFVNMITTQRAYSANSKTITTADQMTQDVLGLIR